MNPRVDFYFHKAGKWQVEVVMLRAILLECKLTEELKWGVPCYTFEGNNIVLIHHFKEYCALLFMKGVLLSDEKGILIQQTKNVQAARQMRFTEASQISKLKKAIKAYVHEAIELEKAGLKVPMKKTAAFTVPEEFQLKLSKDSQLKKAFASLTPGRQRAYLLYFDSAKQAKTRASRIEKYIPKILNGQGLED